MSLPTKRKEFNDMHPFHRRSGMAAVLGLLVTLAGASPTFAQNLQLQTNKGCGNSAVFQVGEGTRFLFSSSLTAVARLTLTKPDGTTQVLVNQTLTGGVTYALNGVAGMPTGTRTLTYTVGGASTTCTYTVGTVTPTTEAQRVLGIIDQGNGPEVTVPATVNAGQPFEVTINTFGSGCEERGDEGVIITDRTATVMVYDFTTATRPGAQCTAIFKRFTHTTTLRLNTPGEAVIQFWGRRTGQGLPPTGIPVVIERRVLVQ